MNLEEIRSQIDCVDEQLVSLLEQRMSLVSQVAVLKKNAGKVVFDPAREKKVLEKTAALIENKEFKEAILDTFSDILKNSRVYQNKKRT
ncbi:MAG: chorismate mutase [Streptococcaceae bacterium]|jgi:chorismate mutase|nr:chorismate mutase [Streptococcaceae bacterium]